MAHPDDVLVEMLDAAADRLAAYGYLLTGSQSAGEELVQAAVVKVFGRRSRFQGPQAAEGYVRATMRTVHIDAMRRESTWRRLLPGEVRTEVGLDASDAFAQRDEVARLLTGLPRQQRTAVILRFYDDLSYNEIAAAMGISLGTVKRYLSDGLTLLGQRLDTKVERVAITEASKR